MGFSEELLYELGSSMSMEDNLGIGTEMHKQGTAIDFVQRVFILPHRTGTTVSNPKSQTSLSGIMVKSYKATPTSDDLDDALNALDLDTNVFAEEEEEEVVGLVAVRQNGDETAGLTTASPDSNEPGKISSTLPLLFAVLAGLLVVLVLLLLLSAWNLWWVLLLVVLGVVVARTQMPAEETFQAKKEIKRIGKHQQRGKNWLQRKANKVTTFLSAEAKNAAGGYDDVQFLDLGVGRLVIVRDLTNGQYHTWMGVWGEWRVWDLPGDVPAAIHQRLWDRSRSRSSAVDGNVV